MKYFNARHLLFLLAITLLVSSCGLQLKETYYINPDMTGKCIVEAKMYADTSKLDATYAKKDSIYGIEKTVPDFHRMKFTRRDAMTLALRILGTKGVEVWSNIRFGMSKKRDMIYFSATAYFRNIAHVHFSVFDSLIRVTKETGGDYVFEVGSKPVDVNRPMMSEDELDKKAQEYKQNAFYIRPVLADLLNMSEETVIYQVPGTITSATVFGQQGDHAAQLTITGNDVLKYADSVVKSTDLQKQHYKATGGTNKGAIPELFNKIVFGTLDPMQLKFSKGGQYLFNYNEEEQRALVYYDDFMQHSGLQRYDSTQMLKEEKAEAKAAAENGVLVVNKSDSEAHKPYFSALTVTQSGDTLFFEGDFSADIKANADAKVHIMKVISGMDIDITDSLQNKTKLNAQLASSKGETTDKVAKRNAKFSVVVHFPPSCKEASVQGRVSTTISDKPGPALAFKLKQIEIAPVKKQ